MSMSHFYSTDSVTNSPALSGYVIASTVNGVGWVPCPPFIKSKEFSDKSSTYILVSVPGVAAKDLDISVDKDKLTVTYKSSIDSDNDFTDDFVLYFDIKHYQNVKKITSKLERGVLKVYIPHKEEYSKNIEISEK